MTRDETATPAPATAPETREEAIARYEAVLASTLDPLLTIDARGVIQSASDSVHGVFGWRPAELVGRNISMLMPQPHRVQHDSYLSEYRRTGQTNILGRARRFEAVRRDGTVFPIELSVSRVDVPGREEPLFTGIIRDITERIRAEQQIRLLEELAVGIASATDLNTGLTVTLERICAASGWEYGEAWVPDPASDRLVDTPVWHMTDLRLERFQQVTRGTTFRRGEGLVGRVWERGRPEWLPTLDDDTLFGRAEIAAHSGLRAGVAVPILDDGEVMAVLAFFMSRARDEDRRMLDLVSAAVAPLGTVFRRRLIENELEQHRLNLETLVSERTAELEATHEQLRLADRLASIGTLAAGLGHDMNNVLLPVRMRLDAFDAADLPATLRAHVASIRGSVEYLQNLTDGLHLLARDPDTGAGEATTDLHGWWRGVHTLLATAVPRRARFDHDLPADLPRVSVAPHRLTQAVLNLVVNAGEAIDETGRIHVWAASFDDRRFVRLAVSDDGHGMAPEIKRRALDPFFTSKKRGLGTGLGLSLVHGVAKSAGGSVRIDSEPGGGTTVIMTLAATDELPAAELSPLTAVVSVADPRIASLAESCLVAMGVSVRRNNASPAPGTADAWLIDPDAAREPAAARFARSGGRVVVLGTPPAGWRHEDSLVIEHPDDFELLRQRLGILFDPTSGETP